MARFSGKVGYAQQTAETAPGVHTEEIVERVYQGEVTSDRRLLVQSEGVNPKLNSGNSISVVADAYLNAHYFAIRYVEWGGVLWTVQDVAVEAPRLILRLGEVYNGPTPG